MWGQVTSAGIRLRTDRRAATAVEYALIAGLVAVAAMAGMIALGLSLDLLFSDISGHIAAVELPRCIEVDSACKK